MTYIDRPAGLDAPLWTPMAHNPKMHRFWGWGECTNTCNHTLSLASPPSSLVRGARAHAPLVRRCSGDSPGSSPRPGEQDARRARGFEHLHVSHARSRVPDPTLERC